MDWKEGRKEGRQAGRGRGEGRGEGRGGGGGKKQSGDSGREDGETEEQRGRQAMVVGEIREPESSEWATPGVGRARGGAVVPRCRGGADSRSGGRAVVRMEKGKVLVSKKRRESDRGRGSNPNFLAEKEETFSTSTLMENQVADALLHHVSFKKILSLSLLSQI
ncbi:hypothetical protein AXG93_4273s1190 [Marchantia polymorpha subsp. ruderalis]|uniref:Uncharacterized protein n=1 Tax=Marchantia polymorpha subsp. ruderalis TaxID=1480154 RepID=A0A176VG45_MARPO|nr:hypothetical protein AXG93_4273s1190 [Marchantia polymorpha subsp. ruderalis]